MPNQDNNQTKAVIYAEVYPYEKEAFKKWWQGKFHSEADAIRCHIRKVTSLDPENQANSETSGEKITSPDSQ